jgi:hypothetical protein
VLIPLIDQGLERLLRSELPLAESVGDVSFDAPSGSWAAQLSRITINAYLFAIGRSTVSVRPAMDRIRPGDDRIERRRPLPMVELSYLVSVYAGSTRDEHQLLGDVMTILETHASLAPPLLSESVESTVSLQLALPDQPRVKDVWNGVSAPLRPSLELTVTTALDGLPFEEMAPRARRIEAMMGNLATGRADADRVARDLPEPGGITGSALSAGGR